jgi:peptidoglycan/xylan/chitin deacetylase (PgdA/CDA1 family)
MSARAVLNARTPPRQPAVERCLRVMIFWDYDTQWGADRSRSAGGRKQWGALEFTQTERLLELHGRFDWKACFAVVAAAALPGQRPYHDPAQIRAIHAAGHEIASHSMYHDWLPAMGLKRLREDLRRSRETLEQCIGAPVKTFVPPFNQPFDFPDGWAISVSERRQVRTERTGLKNLCEALGETGYQYCRVAVRPMHWQAMEWLLRRRVERILPPVTIAGIRCLRLTNDGGFAESASRQLIRSAGNPGLMIAYGHPHSTASGNTQDASLLTRFLVTATTLRSDAQVIPVLPKELQGSHPDADVCDFV